MTTMTLKQVERIYANNGQHAEYSARYNITGEYGKADNKPFWTGGDVLDIQIKSAKATVCKGTDILAHIKRDGAKRYGYVTKDFATMYIMNPAEYAEFVNRFSSVTYDSKKNGGGVKLRLKSESKAMMAWLAAC
jgi:hypothetical protein